MENKYLEKIASRTNEELRARGLAVPGQTNKALRGSWGIGEAGKGEIANGSSKFIKGTAGVPGKKGILGFGSKPAIGATKDRVVNSTRLSGDKLAEGPSLKTRLATHKAGTFRAPEKVSIGANAGSIAKSSPKPIAKSGILNKALALAKANPKATLGIGAVGALVGARALSKKSPESQGY